MRLRDPERAVVRLVALNLVVAMGACLAGCDDTTTSATKPVTAASSAPATLISLSLEDVLAWRATYGDLLGKPREAVVERFGEPQREEGSALDWDAAPKTANRWLIVGFDSADKHSLVQAVRVGSRSAEQLDVVEILKKAPMFTFETGTYRDAVRATSLPRQKTNETYLCSTYRKRA